MAKKNSLFSGRKARKSSVDKFKESDLYKKIYGKTHEERVQEYKEWRYGKYGETKGWKAHERIGYLIEQLSAEDANEFRDFYDEDDPDNFFELGQKVISGEDVKDIKKKLKEKDKLPTSPTGG